MEAKNYNNVLSDAVLVLLLIGGAGYYRYKPQIEEKLHDPSFILLVLSGLAFLGTVFYAIGHQVEKYMNRFKMWQSGIKLMDIEISYPFVSFDLQKQLDAFYQVSENRERTFLGLCAESNNKEIVSIPDIQRSQHLQVLGMTGTGKTASVFLPLIYQDALKRRPVIILDAKGEESTIAQLNAMLESIGRSDDFLLFSLVHKKLSCTYNPLYVGECDPQIIIDAFFNNFKDDNSFYRETAKIIFTNAYFVLQSVHNYFTIMDVYTYLTNDACRNEINRQVTEENKKGMLHLKLLNRHIKQLTNQFKGWEHVVTGFHNYLLAHKDELLNDPDSDIILTDVIRQKKIVYFQLPTNAYPIQAVSIARMVQANLRYISSLIQSGIMSKDMLVSVIIDEYSSFAEESFVEVLNKARSSGMMVTVAHQSLSDLKAISDTFMSRIDENTLNKICFKQSDPVLCELISKSMGTYTKEEKTYRMTGGRFGNQLYSGESSNKTVNEFYFPPDRIKNLNKFGQGYYLFKGDNTQKCINFGQFENMCELPYRQKSKREKKDGLRLFEKHYLTTKVVPDMKSHKDQLDEVFIDDLPGE